LQLRLRRSVVALPQQFLLLHHVGQILEVGRTSRDDQLPSLIVVPSVLVLLFDGLSIQVNRVLFLFAIVFVFDQIEPRFNQNESIFILDFLLTMSQLLLWQSLNGEKLVWVDFYFADVGFCFVDFVLVVLCQLLSSKQPLLNARKQRCFVLYNGQL
jgi:hypothetical protein